MHRGASQSPIFQWKLQTLNTLKNSLDKIGSLVWAHNAAPIYLKSPYNQGNLNRGRAEVNIAMGSGTPNPNSNLTKFFLLLSWSIWIETGEEFACFLCQKWATCSPRAIGGSKSPFSDFWNYLWPWLLKIDSSFVPCWKRGGGWKWDWQYKCSNRIITNFHPQNNSRSLCLE